MNRPYACPRSGRRMVVQLVFGLWLGWLAVGAAPGAGGATLGFYLLDSLRAGKLQQFSAGVRHFWLLARSHARG